MTIPAKVCGRVTVERVVTVGGMQCGSRSGRKVIEHIFSERSAVITFTVR